MKGCRRERATKCRRRRRRGNRKRIESRVQDREGRPGHSGKIESGFLASPEMTILGLRDGSAILASRNGLAPARRQRFGKRRREKPTSPQARQRTGKQEKDKQRQERENGRATTEDYCAG